MSKKDQGLSETSERLAGRWALLSRALTKMGCAEWPQWRGEPFPDKAALALRVWGLWGDPGMRWEPSALSAGAVGLRPSRWRPLWERPEPVEAIALSPSGERLSLARLAAYGGQIASGLGLPRPWAREDDASRWWAKSHPDWRGVGPVPGCGKRGRWWAGDRRRLRGALARRRWAGDALAGAEGLMDLDPALGALGASADALRRAAAADLSGLPGPWDDWRPNRGRGRTGWKASRPAQARGVLGRARPEWADAEEGGDGGGAPWG